MKKSKKIWTSVQWFKGLGLMLLIQKDCLMSLEGNRMDFVAWNDLELGFQFWVFKPKFQGCQWSSCAAQWSFWLGLYSGLCNEPIRSRILIKISCIHGFWDLIFKIFFQIFSMCFCTNHDQFSPNLSIFEYARIIE